MQTKRTGRQADPSTFVRLEAATLRKLDLLAAMDARRCARTLRAAGHPEHAEKARELVTLYLRRARAVRATARPPVCYVCGTEADDICRAVDGQAAECPRPNWGFATFADAGRT